MNLVLHHEDVNQVLHREDVNLVLHHEDVNLVLHHEDVNQVLHREDVNLVLHLKDETVAVSETIIIEENWTIEGIFSVLSGDEEQRRENERVEGKIGRISETTSEITRSFR